SHSKDVEHTDVGDANSLAWGRTGNCHRFVRCTSSTESEHSGGGIRLSRGIQLSNARAHEHQIQSFWQVPDLRHDAHSGVSPKIGPANAVAKRDSAVRPTPTRLATHASCDHQFFAGE